MKIMYPSFRISGIGIKGIKYTRLSSGGALRRPESGRGLEQLNVLCYGPK